VIEDKKILHEEMQKYDRPIVDPRRIADKDAVRKTKD